MLPRTRRRAAWLTLLAWQALAGLACDDRDDPAPGLDPSEDAGGGSEETFRCPSLGEASDDVDFPDSAWCDGVIDCLGSGEDERECPERKQFVCQNLSLGRPELIDESRICDGKVDCVVERLQDEQGCGTPLSTSLLCLPGFPPLAAEKVCDGKWDCWNDEQECPSDGERFACLNGKSIPAANVCDGYANCSDGSDEITSECPGQIECPQIPNRSTTNPSEGPKYFLADRHCDGRVDCGGGVDEVDCGSYVHCTTDLLVRRSQVCDGQRDCPNGRDEERCPQPKAPMPMNPSEGASQ